MVTFKPNRRRDLRELRSGLTLLALALVSIVLHIRFGRHRILVVNNRGVDVRALELRVAGERRAVGPLSADGIISGSFRNPWPRDASVSLRLEGADGVIEERECLFLGVLPEVAVVRLVADGVDCRNIYPALPMP